MQIKVFALLLSFVLLLLCGCASSMGTAANSPSDKKTASESTTPSEQTDAQVPTSYAQILADFAAVLEFRLSDSFESDHNSGITPELSDALNAQITGELIYRWDCMLVEMVASADQLSKDAYGYILMDINLDGTPELFWVRADRTILAVFTAKAGQAQLLDAYWPRYDAVVTETGMLYTVGSSGAAYNDHKIYRISENGAALIPAAEFGMEGEIYYEVVDGEKTEISKARFEELLIAYPFQMSPEWKATPITLIAE